jgi:hypothetical protein
LLLSLRQRSLATTALLLYGLQQLLLLELQRLSLVRELVLGIGQSPVPGLIGKRQHRLRQLRMLVAARNTLRQSMPPIIQSAIDGGQAAAAESFPNVLLSGPYAFFKKLVSNLDNAAMCIAFSGHMVRNMY